LRRIFLGAVLLILACGGAATLPAPSQSSPRPATVSTTPIDVTDMMGAFPAATFFVVTDDGVKALAVLNHWIKYTIPTTGAVQVAAGGNQIYIADEVGDGTRLRWIDQATGNVLATRTEPSRRLVATGIGHGALAVEPTSSRLLALYADGGRRVVEGYEAYSLRPQGRRFDSSCGDRLLAGASRVAVACFAAGELVISDNETKAFVLRAGLGTLVASAISADGTMLVGRDDGTLARIVVATSTVEKIEPFRPGKLVPDGIASYGVQSFAVALATSDQATAISEARATQRYISFPAALAPNGGILAQGQFAFWTTAAGQARHIDLLQGFQETMAPLTGKTLPGGVGQ
jgi:hypothetical protein